MELSNIVLWDKNPRKITAEAFEKLKQSLKNDLAFLKEDKIKLNDINGQLVVYAGNQRVKALIELGYKELSDEYFSVAKIDEKTMIERGIIDNEEFGEYDKDKLAELRRYVKVELDFDFDSLTLPNTAIYNLNRLSDGFDMLDFSDDLGALESKKLGNLGSEELNDENKNKKRDQNYVIRAEIIFDHEGQRETWNYFLHHLKENYGGETLSERLENFINQNITEKGKKLKKS